MIVLKVVINIVLILVLILLAIMLSSHFTGRDRRAYKVLLPTDNIIIAGDLISIENLAQKYKPKMYLRPSTITPKLKWIWYEAIPTDSTIDLTYHYTWENEINPNKTIHRLYSIYRAAYYGAKLFDIEYFQVNVNRETGDVQRLRFETSENDDYFSTIIKHIIISAERENNGQYSKTIINTDGKFIGQKEPIYFEFDNNRVNAGVQTWNHLSRLLDKSALIEYSILQDEELKYLSDSEYRQYKFTRKSQGDHKTKENRITLCLSSLLAFIFITVPIYLMRNKKRLGQINS